VNPTIFADQLMAATLSVLPWLGAGVAAGIVALAAVFGIRLGMSSLRTVAGGQRGQTEAEFERMSDEYYGW